MKGSTNKRSKLPVEAINAERKAKIDKRNDAQDVVVISDSNGVRITFNGGLDWVGISPVVARRISRDLLTAATDSEKKKKDKVK